MLRDQALPISYQPHPDALRDFISSTKKME